VAETDPSGAISSTVAPGTMAPVESATVPVKAGSGERAAGAGETEAGVTAKTGAANTSMKSRGENRNANAFKAQHSSAND
jgi:hypothetical protein